MPVVTGGTWGEQSARRLGGYSSQVSNEYVSEAGGGIGYPAFINAGLAHMALDVAELIRRLVDGCGSYRRGRGTHDKVVLGLVLQLLVTANRNAGRGGLGVEGGRRGVERGGRRGLADGRGNGRGDNKVVQIHVIVGGNGEVRL